MTVTLGTLAARTGLAVDPHLASDIAIPVVAGPQAQGDLVVIPIDMLAAAVTVRPDAGWVQVSAGGVEVIRGAAMGNPHQLVADAGTCRWTTQATDRDGLAIGVLEASAPVWLLHREHGATGIAPGTYVVRRQREQADALRLVAD